MKLLNLSGGISDYFAYFGKNFHGMKIIEVELPVFTLHQKLELLYICKNIEEIFEKFWNSSPKSILEKCLER